MTGIAGSQEAFDRIKELEAALAEAQRQIIAEHTRYVMADTGWKEMNRQNEKLHQALAEAQSTANNLAGSCRTCHAPSHIVPPTCCERCYHYGATEEIRDLKQFLAERTRELEEAHGVAQALEQRFSESQESMAMAARTVSACIGERTEDRAVIRWQDEQLRFLRCTCLYSDREDAETHATWCAYRVSRPPEHAPAISRAVANEP